MNIDQHFGAPFICLLCHILLPVFSWFYSCKYLVSVFWKQLQFILQQYIHLNALDISLAAWNLQQCSISLSIHSFFWSSFALRLILSHTLLNLTKPIFVHFYCRYYSKEMLSNFSHVNLFFNFSLSSYFDLFPHAIYYIHTHTSIAKRIL